MKNRDKNILPIPCEFRMAVIVSDDLTNLVSVTSMVLPTPKEIKQKISISSNSLEKIDEFRKGIEQIIEGKSPKLAIVTGPCSIHDPSSALEYAKRLKELSDRVHDSCFLVMRVYIEKPRTKAGWKGLLYDPFLDGTHDLVKGITLSREILVSIAELGIPIATEFLDPLASCYYSDLVSWGFIGARTSLSPIHRQLASSLEIPIGFKNSTDGDLEGAINGILSSQMSHVFLGIDDHGRLSEKNSLGNPHTHLVLRGSYHSPNYEAAHVNMAEQKLLHYGIQSRILIDCSHDNCGKQHEKQKEVFFNVIDQIEHGNDKIMGVMLESHLEAGSQSLSEGSSSVRSSVSITDPCIDWSSTEELISSVASSICSSMPSS